MQTVSSDQIEIEFRNVSKRFKLTEGKTLREFVPALFRGNGFTEPFYALRDVNFQIRRAETVGIIGKNGSGKSTALKLIAGVTAPSIGDVYRVTRNVLDRLRRSAAIRAWWTE